MEGGGRDMFIAETAVKLDRALRENEEMRLAVAAIVERVKVAEGLTETVGKLDFACQQLMQRQNATVETLRSVHLADLHEALASWRDMKPTIAKLHYFADVERERSKVEEDLLSQLSRAQYTASKLDALAVKLEAQSDKYGRLLVFAFVAGVVLALVFGAASMGR